MHNIYIYILVMGVVTFLIRAVPLTLIRSEIKSPFLRSFLYYVPFATLSAMTFPSILSATGSTVSAIAGFTAAIILSLRNKSLLIVAAGACAAVFLTELLTGI